ncbi:hypothetical protein [Paucimonas lemoignei]|nr:hypothetical protein [Paucimonas lemoignei]
MKSRRSRLQHMLLGILLAIVLAATFMAYLRPSFIVDLANRLVLCT